MNAAEQWRPILGWEGLYEVSNEGRVRSCEGRRQRPIVLVPLKTDKGYLRANLYAPGGRKERRTIHRAVLEAFVGPCPEGQQGCHNDGDRTNNRLENLRWDTPAGNSRDKLLHGTHNMARKTECKHGHPFDEANTRHVSLASGRKMRVCRTCARENARRLRAESKERAA
jgi:hypothetical protein